jgi:hypothetical protein
MLVLYVPAMQLQDKIVNADQRSKVHGCQL